ncbi:MAG: M23 family metallopeptidase [Bacteroidetes bacterium]|jgi:Membrane proteins related to metalloendopeptidases|nr:MAG: M23 family metallopeptidase [Bacteroidota bacterium]
MAQDKKDKKKMSWMSRLRNKYRLVIMNDETLEERLTFRLSRLNVFVVLGTLTIILIILTSILIAFTPLREYIPGYTNVGLQKKLYELQIKTDSIEKGLEKRDLFIQNMKDVMNGKDLSTDVPLTKDTLHKYNNIKLKKSPEDSLLRAEVENQGKYNLYRFENSENVRQKNASIGKVLFFVPLKGVITNEFNPSQNHYGVDIVSKQNEAIKCVLDGTVILSNWTLETGYTIAIQHQQNIVSVYKHNSALLKKEGEFVKAGDPIAIIGQTGELTTGPHLHFELWSDGNPVNPKDYINF